MPKQMKKLLEVISSNRRLQFLNLSFNNICNDATTDKE
jgi:hypothetical protein